MSQDASRDVVAIQLACQSSESEKPKPHAGTWRDETRVDLTGISHDETRMKKPA